MSESVKKPLARIVDEIEYPEMYMEGFVMTVQFSLNGKKFGRTLSVVGDAPDDAIRYAFRKLQEEVIRTRSDLQWEVDK